MIRVMVVDDSPLARRIVSDILSADPEISVIATAASGEFALLKLEKEAPDVITMDLEMPGMGGLEAIRQIMAIRPTPIIILSAHARAGAEATLLGLENGAQDFVLKPTNTLSGGITAVAAELTEKVKSASRILVQRRELAETAPAKVPTAAIAQRAVPRVWMGGGCDIVAIGTSTGGPVALKTVLMGLPEDFPVGIVVVQHMPPVFTKAFADRLDSCCAISVKEAEDGDPIVPGRALIAPGDYHMVVSRFGTEPRVSLHQKELVSGHRPSVNVMVHSVALEYGSAAVGVIMTGMGNDGADAMHELRKKGGWIIAQDKASSVIYGMNREVVRAGDANEEVPLDTIAERIQERAGARTTTGKAQ